MAITYATWAAEVLGNLEIRSDDAAEFNLDYNLNRAQDAVVNAVAPRFLYNLVTDTGSTALTTTLNAYDLPADFCRFIRLWIDYTRAISASNIGTPAREVDVFEYQDFSNIDLLPSFEKPIVFIGNEGKFVIQPAPLGVANQCYNMMYIKRPATVATGTDCQLHDNLRNLLVFKATALCAAVENYSKIMADQYNEFYHEELKLFLPKSIKPNINKE